MLSSEFSWEGEGGVTTSTSSLKRKNLVAPFMYVGSGPPRSGRNLSE